ncbi:MAG: HAD family hydrolase, partial [Verrucomicrobiaceae bacterium]|nr:HAD family hydrolase [Verrucomicrobiaceae bacterium]
MKQLIVFDLDGTLAVSKSSLDPEMAGLISTMLGIVRVADNKHFTNLSLLPTCGTKFYQYDTTWKLLYAENLTADEKQKIIRSLHQVADNADIKLKKGWGEIFEDRGSQITFSALGQQAAIEVKEIWDPDFAKRKRMKERLDQLLPEFSVRIGGPTSIDVTKPGIDKAHGIRKLCDIL